VDREFLRGISIYRPYGGEAPLHLLEPGYSEQLFDDALAALEQPARPVGHRGPMRIQELLFMRVAKHDERTEQESVAAYVVRARTAISFELQHLLVDSDFRGRGLGRWLLGHAIGLAETKGARELLVVGEHHQQAKFLSTYGFVQTPQGWIFTFTPE
jgi:GNAT superfamily N-acetyltransferase